MFYKYVYNVNILDYFKWDHWACSIAIYVSSSKFNFHRNHIEIILKCRFFISNKLLGNSDLESMDNTLSSKASDNMH